MFNFQNSILASHLKFHTSSPGVQQFFEDKPELHLQYNGDIHERAKAEFG